MTEPTPEVREAAVAAATGLAKAVSDFSADVAEVKADARRNKRVLRVMAGSLLFDLILSIVLGIVAFNADQASGRASEATSVTAVQAQRDHTTCLTANDARAAGRELWDFVLAQPPDPDNTPEETEQRAQAEAQFRTLLDRVSVQRDCSPPTTQEAP